MAGPSERTPFDQLGIFRSDLDLCDLSIDVAQEQRDTGLPCLQYQVVVAAHQAIGRDLGVKAESAWAITPRGARAERGRSQ